MGTLGDTRGILGEGNEGDADDNDDELAISSTHDGTLRGYLGTLGDLGTHGSTQNSQNQVYTTIRLSGLVY